jgi:hypothetical protein
MVSRRQKDWRSSSLLRLHLGLLPLEIIVIEYVVVDKINCTNDPITLSCQSGTIDCVFASSWMAPITARKHCPSVDSSLNQHKSGSHVAGLS